jgi:hypothetical protein
MGMISKVFEEDSPAQQGQLESLDVDVCMESSPGVGSYGIGYDSRKETIQVAEKEDCPICSRQSYVLGFDPTFWY